MTSFKGTMLLYNPCVIVKIDSSILPCQKKSCSALYVLVFLSILTPLGIKSWLAVLQRVRQNAETKRKLQN